ncbi:MAG: hypothetical protein DYG92_08900, partial [Leptolyngbya sp. PLA1]|nr:hypothetical protein [Leptolyngbya sp. PLA1]
MDPALESRFHAAITFARDAASLIRAAFDAAPASAVLKPDNTPVTETDKAAERLLRDAIRERFPNDSILGEEFGGIGGSSRWGWVLDPIDGTASFVHGVPLFGTIVAITCDTRPVAGVVDLPALGE